MSSLGSYKNEGLFTDSERERMITEHMALAMNYARDFSRSTYGKVEVSDAEWIANTALFKTSRNVMPNTSFKALFKTIVKRDLLTHMKRGKLGPVNDDSLERIAASEKNYEGHNGEMSYEERDAVDNYSKGVDPLYFEALRLKSVGEMSCKEISEKFGIPPGTVMSRVHRARERIRETYRGRELAGA
ncbi:MAG: sigma-70 family RNA polymerase sigma factor [Nanoarchaeota archaeon]